MGYLRNWNSNALDLSGCFLRISWADCILEQALSTLAKHYSEVMLDSGALNKIADNLYASISSSWLTKGAKDDTSSTSAILLSKPFSRLNFLMIFYSTRFFSSLKQISMTLSLPCSEVKMCVSYSSKSERMIMKTSCALGKQIINELSMATHSYSTKGSVSIFKNGITVSISPLSK